MSSPSGFSAPSSSRSSLENQTHHRRVDPRLNPHCQLQIMSYGAAAVTGLQVRCPTCKEILELRQEGWRRRPY